MLLKGREFTKAHRPFFAGETMSIVHKINGVTVIEEWPDIKPEVNEKVMRMAFLEAFKDFDLCCMECADQNLHQPCEACPNRRAQFL